MIDNRNEWIAARAYALWEQAGRPLGQDELHWEQAVLERNLLERTRASSDGAEVYARVPRRADPDPVEGRSVLIVEDEPQLRYNIVDFLDKAGYRTLEAANADEALIHLRHNDVDALYTDINMPGSMDGLGLVATVRSRWPHMRIIVTSGFVNLSHRDLEAGVTFVSKPTSGLELLNLMANSA
ncbi:MULTISPECIES: response regulator [Rhizobium]|jgi:CheY-like chemotaxis protein|uniref:response regulator n=1 Tax=Rhizobium TaxID=379 RepID=UPI00027D8111|nr:response regulator [Rhizobium leguminosarum]MBY2945194.1 response regulator [Rhizobium leguminosarum]MBY2952180.1 response regulator [Rhizobium leguminosarum]MBY2988632.1 response regulator [Rhizobium leguminosarum]MBY2996980.1 response regulator [Rhizobium leguminosarum]MBY3034437.1 response regulator [Rhizobium leguminosarum]